MAFSTWMCHLQGSEVPEHFIRGGVLPYTVFILHDLCEQAGSRSKAASLMQDGHVKLWLLGQAVTAGSHRLLHAHASCFQILTLSSMVLTICMIPYILRTQHIMVLHIVLKTEIIYTNSINRQAL
jgi:hypothetical protein